MYYTYAQNNTGGFWRGPQYVIIKADSAADANEKAEWNGIYFNGVNLELDCECCGDRWCRVLEKEGTEVPTIHGDSDLTNYDYKLCE